MNLAESFIYKTNDAGHSEVESSQHLSPDTLSRFKPFYSWPSHTTVGFLHVTSGSCDSEYLLAGHPRAGPSSQLSTNGPSTFDEALKHFKFSDEEWRKIVDDPVCGSSTISQRAPTVLRQPSHLSPQWYSTQPIHYSRSQYLSPNQAMAAAHHQGARHYYPSRQPFSTRF